MFHRERSRSDVFALEIANNHLSLISTIEPQSHQHIVSGGLEMAMTIGRMHMQALISACLRTPQVRHSKNSNLREPGLPGCQFRFVVAGGLNALYVTYEQQGVVPPPAWAPAETNTPASKAKWDTVHMYCT